MNIFKVVTLLKDGHANNKCFTVLNFVPQIYRISGIFRVGKFWRKYCLEGVLYFHLVQFSLNEDVEFIFRCLFLAISGGRELSENVTHAKKSDIRYMNHIIRNGRCRTDT